MRWNRFFTPGRVIAAGFAFLILLGTGLLMLPISHQSGQSLSFIDALFTATSGVCITGLSSIQCNAVLSGFGQAVLLLLIQIGGMGITTLGVGIILLTGKKIGIRERTLIKESLNQPSFQGILRLLKVMLMVTFGIEGAGAVLSFPIFVQDYPVGKAVWLSVFHSVSAFNNAGFDLIGGSSLAVYRNHVPMLLLTSALTICGGLGFVVMLNIAQKRRFRRFSLHTKVVLTMTVLLLTVGTLLLHATQHGLTWVQSFFYSAVTRTSGFSIYDLGDFSNASLLCMVLLMFVGAAPGSTGGGIKVTTLFVCIWSAIASTRNQHPTVFRRRFSQEVRDKALMIFLMGLSVVLVSTFLLCMLEPECFVHSGADGNHLCLCDRGAFLRADWWTVRSEQAGSDFDDVHRAAGTADGGNAVDRAGQKKQRDFKTGRNYFCGIITGA